MIQIAKYVLRRNNVICRFREMKVWVSPKAPFKTVNGFRRVMNQDTAAEQRLVRT